MLSAGMQALGAYRQFILWRKLERAGKTDKIPCSPYTLEPCDAHDPAQWTDEPTAAALAACSGEGWGVGFVLTDHDPFFCLDLDHCRTQCGWAPGVAEMLATVPGAAIELSQSGTGLHAWGVAPPQPHRTRPEPGAGCPWPASELYTRRRFIALGTYLQGNAATPVNLGALTQGWFAPQAAADPGTPAEWRDAPLAHWRGPSDDGELLERALRSTSAAAAFGAGVTFADLWTADGDALARRWPAAGGWDESAADAALAAHLAFWTGHDCERMLRLMGESALMRPKWERVDYLRRTILLACQSGREVLQDAPVVAPAMGTDPAPAATARPLGGKPTARLREGRTMLSAAEQMELFAGCVYIRLIERVYVPGTIYTLNRAQFDATFGGYAFVTNDGKLCKSAWDAFTGSSVVNFPRVDEAGFDPQREPGVCYRDVRGVWCVNTYEAPECDAAPGDVALWWDHLNRLFPEPNDRDIFFSWCCAVVRNPGQKFTWSPLVVSGEGTGKTLVFDALRAAMGWRYTRSVRGGSLVSQFNDWIGQTLLCVVEDFRLPKSADRDALTEALKEMVAGARYIESEGKGKASCNVENRCNFIFAANALDVLRIDRGSRRFAPLVVGCWSRDEIEARGMDADYFLRLREWMASPGGIAALRHLLLTWPIPDRLNPATHCIRAPQTSTGDILFKANASGPESILEDAVMAGLSGLRGGWACVEAVRAVLAAERIAISPVAARRLLERMGYSQVPGLSDGWTNHPVAPYNRRIRLFAMPQVIGNLRAAGELPPQAAIIRMFTEAQDVANSMVPVFGAVPGQAKALR